MKKFISDYTALLSRFKKYIPFFICFGLILTFIPQNLFSQWQWQNPLPQGNILFGSHYINPNTGWACGDGGTIIKTTDGGLNWTVNKTRTKQSIRSLYFFDANKGFASGLFGTVLKTTDGGSNWNKVILNTTGNLFAVRFLNNSTGFIAGDTGVVFKTTDGGSTWNRKITNVSRSLTCIAMVDSIVVAAGLNATVVRSSDYGETWQIINPNNNNYFFDVMFKNSTTGFLAGTYGAIVRTTDAGLSWSTVSTATNRWFYSISFGDDNTGFAASDYGNIARTTNGGLSWISYGTPTSEFQYALKAFSVNDIISVGNKGTILKSTNAGLNWTDHSSGFRNTLYSIDFIDDDHGLSCGQQGTIAITSDAGNTWTRVQAGSTDDFLNQIDFVNTNVAFCSGEDGVILKTSNGGNNWFNLNSTVTAGLYSLQFLDENYGWVCGDSGKLLKTTDGGNNFTLFQQNPSYYISDVFFIDQNIGWYSSGERKIYKTTNGGNNWFVPHANVFGGGVGAVQFVDPLNGVGFTFDNKILLTADGGVLWDQVSIPANNYLNNIYAVDKNNIWTIGDFGFVYRSVDAGHTWFSETENNLDGRLFGIYFINPNSGWITGANGGIIKYKDPLIGISQNSGLNPEQFILQQNYPNPFNPSTIISYDMNEAGFVSINIFDVTGRQITSLVDQFQSAGSYKVKFDGSNLSSGTYFYRINIHSGNLRNSDFTSVKSMLLIK
ncbi:MAG: YCF48-related protein [bacterium]